MRYLFWRVTLYSILLSICLLLPPPTFAQETGFLVPTTCITDGSSCDNIQLQDTLYNSWINTLSNEIIVTFTSFGIPTNAIIDDIQIKFRVRTSPQGGWSWFPYVSTDGITYRTPLNCKLSPDSCHFNTTTTFNAITTTTFTWLNNNPQVIVDGTTINDPAFRMKLLHTTSVKKNTDVDVLLFNIRYHIAEPTPTPLPTATPPPIQSGPTPTPTPTKTPLIFIPGIGGSELKVASDVIWSENDGHGDTFTHIYPKDEKIWVNTVEAAKPGNDDYFDVLKMNPDGSSLANIALTGNLFSSYQSTIEFFTSHGYTLNTNFFIFPYDWRKDINHTKILLDQKIEAIQQATGAQKVDIVAHSMGGLVSRNYISDPLKATNVRKLFTLGTPHLGAVKFLKTVMYGDCQTIFDILKQPICFGISTSEVKDVLQNTIGGYELAPSQKYFSFYSNSDSDHPSPFVDMRDIDNNGVTGPLNYPQIKTLLSNLQFNAALFTPSETFHTLDDTLIDTNGVDVRLIAGSGITTIGQIVEKYVVDFLGVKIPKKDELSINGDGTVPLFSASLSDPANNLSLLGNAKVYYTNQTHGDLVTPGPAMDLVTNILNDTTNLPTGVSLQPVSFSGTSISVHSPVNLNIYDNQGRHTGPTTDGFEEGIPGSQYDMLDDAKFIFLPDNGVYTITLEATDKGSFDFIIRKYVDNTNIKTTYYKNVPLTEFTKAETILDTESIQPPTLTLDQNGDGIVDTQVVATGQAIGSQNNDHTPPSTTIHLNGIKGTNNWFTGDVIVTLDATDDDSGVAQITYSLDNGTTITPYTQPFTLDVDGIYTLKVKSIDNAGNEEDPQEIPINIDKTPPEAKIFVDQDLQDLVVQGMDTNPTIVTRQPNTTTKKKDDAVYAITDNAGNSLQLDVRDRNKNKLDTFEIYTLTYNNTSPLQLENNHYNVTYEGKKTKLNLKEQNLEIEGDIKIRIQYDPKKNMSTIFTKEGKQEKVKEVRSGITILQLVTTNGSLAYSY